MQFTTVEDILFSISLLSGLVLLVMFLLKKLHQPYLISYILTGVLIGPSALKIFTDPEDILMLGELGLLLHLFFMGTEIEIPDSKTELLKPIAAQMIKLVLSGIGAFLIGTWLHWTFVATFVIFCILIFNSTAIASEYLKRTGETQTILGKTTLNVLLLQDLLFGPVLILLQLVQNKNFPIARLLGAFSICIFIIWFLWMARTRKRFSIPRLPGIENDHELQIFLGFAICGVSALVASKAGITASFGGFLAGIIISRTIYLTWLEKMLRPFYVFFMCLFFMSMGLALDIAYILENLNVVLIVTLAIILINSIFSALAFRLLKYKWSDSFYAGALMSQIGEYSLLITSVAFQTGIFSNNLHKGIVSICCSSILLSTIWITLMRAFIFRQNSFMREFINHHLINLLPRRDKQLK